MSGHSKWATTHRQKEITDKQRAKEFTRRLRAVSVAVKTGGSTDPDKNQQLKIAIQNAKGANVPKDRIENAINKANSDNSNYNCILYEATWKNVQLMIMCTTDNTNRTVSEVRKILRDYNASLGVSGAVKYNFTEKGFFMVKKQFNTDFDEFLYSHNGIEDGYEYDEDSCCIICAKSDFGSLQQCLEKENCEITDSGLKFYPINTIEIDEENITIIDNLIQELEDLEDVQYVATNIENAIPQSLKKSFSHENFTLS